MVQTEENLVNTASERYFLVYTIVVLIVIISLVVLFFVVFRKRTNKLLLDEIEQQRAFEQEIVQVQTEAQEQALKNIGWELYDDVDQLLSFAIKHFNNTDGCIYEK